MEENTQNSFEWYIDLFTFHILPINYATFMSQILIFGFNWVQNTIVPKYFLIIRSLTFTNFKHFIKNHF